VLPFIPKRKRYYYSLRHARSDPHPPTSFLFRWEDELKFWQRSNGSESLNLQVILETVLQIPSYAYEAPRAIMDLPLSADWLVRPDTDIGYILHAIEQYLAKELGRQIDFERRTLNREVIIAKGRFRYRYLPGVPTLKVHMFADRPDPDGGNLVGTAGSISKFLDYLGDYIGLYVIDETDPVDLAASIPYGHHQSTYLVPFSVRQFRVL